MVQRIYNGRLYGPKNIYRKTIESLRRLKIGIITWFKKQSLRGLYGLENRYSEDYMVQRSFIEVGKTLC